MISMIMKMSGITVLYIILTLVVWNFTNKVVLNRLQKIMIGVVFGTSSIISTHFGVAYDGMIINVRDIGPLAAGLFFSPTAGVVAGLIGGIERYIAGTYFGVGSYTRIACSVSTCLAGFVAMIMKIKMFDRKKPSPFYALFMGAVMEVFHMYVVFITHRNDMRMAFLVVSTCAVPMIIFTAIGMCIASILLQVLSGEWVNPFQRIEEEKEPLSRKFQKWLFLIMSIVILGSFIFSYILQTQTANQYCKSLLIRNFTTIESNYDLHETNLNADSNIEYGIITNERIIFKGKNIGATLSEAEYKKIIKNLGSVGAGTFFGVNSIIYARNIDESKILAVTMPKSEVYWYRDAQAYEFALADILLFTVIYVLIAYLVNQIVVNNIQLINTSLSKITNGNLNEVVTVRSSSEFASLSDDINQTVVALKGYIKAAEKRIEQELIFARTIQTSSLPQVFNFPDIDEFELFASMNPAKEVGGDFYDFFFADRNKIAFVIADVSGKGIPAALFMMRSKTAIRSFAEAGGTPEEILIKTNEALCEGNDAEMFVTVWIGILDLTTGYMQCANAGHEYPAIMHEKGKYELIKDKHSVALAAVSGVKPKPYQLKLEPHDRIFVYTDGVPEAINEKEEQYGTERMLEVLNTTANISMEETLNKVTASVNSFKGEAEQFDDITMLGFEFIKLLEK